MGCGFWLLYAALVLVLLVTGWACLRVVSPTYLISDIIRDRKQ
jgi:hypothetical protein